jgi:hypothetical protein
MTGRITLITMLAAAALLLISPRSGSAQQEIQNVAVTNFPPVQAVAGTVAVEGTVRHATMLRVKEVLITPVARETTTRLIDGGELTTDGFTSIVLALNGRVQGKPLQPGTVGAILIPDEESVLRAFDEESQMQFPLEIDAEVPAGSARSFASPQKRVTVAFPRYRVRFYNTSDRTVTANLFAYLTN